MSTEPEALRLCDTWTINYGLERSPHDLHEFWKNGAPPGCALALKAAVDGLRAMHAQSLADEELMREVEELLLWVQKELWIEDEENEQIDAALSRLRQRLGE